MSIFEEAKINFKKNNYLRSAELFEKAIKVDELSLEEQSFAWDKIRLIHQNLNKRLTFSALNEMAQVYQEVRSYEKASEILYELYRETNELFYLNEVYKNTIASGDMKEARSIAHQYVEKLIKGKRSDEIFQFISENEAKFDAVQVVLWKANGDLISGDRSSFLELYESCDVLDHQNLILQEYVKYAEKKAHFWQSDLTLMKILFKRLSEVNIQIILSKKQVGKLILNIWMENNIDQDIMIMTVKVAQRYQLSIIGIAIAQYMGDIELEERFKEEGPKRGISGDVDLGEDLFIEEASDGKSEESIIIRNIELLQSLGREGDAERELNRLRKINPKHVLLSSEIIEIPINSEELFNDLMSEFLKYTYNSDTEINKKKDKIEDGYEKIANYYDWEYIQENYEDMIIGLNLLSLFNVALSVANMVNEKILQEDEVINLEYLKLETLMRLQQYFTVKDGVDDMINNFPIKGNELLSLLYLRAEAFNSLMQYKNAYHAFNEISKIKKNYRNTRQRLKELEKHK